MSQQDAMLVMLDMLVRTFLLEILKAVVWGPVLFVAIKWGTAKKGR
jgi:hypothetical protein